MIPVAYSWRHHQVSSISIKTKLENMFKSDAGSLEECRADGVALFLSADPQVLSIFSIDERSKVTAGDSKNGSFTIVMNLELKFAVTYISWLHFMSGALKGLSIWDPKAKVSLIMCCRTKI
jgi:hypothetical protein